LRDFVTFINGDRSSNYPSSEDNDPNGWPFVSATELVNGKLEIKEVRRISQTAYDRLGSGKFKAGDILFCLRGSVGKVAPVPTGVQGAIASSLVIVRPKNIDPQFLLNLLSSPRFQQAVQTRDNGSVQGNLSVKELGQLPIRVPERSLQRAIAAPIALLDQQIESLRHQNETLEAIAQAVFKSWFVDFDPVKFKAEGREPEGMDAATAALFPSEFEDSELGPIPKGWGAIPVYGLADFANGAAYKESHFSPNGEGLPIIKIAELKSGVTSSTKFTTTNLGEKYRIEENELLFSWSGNPDTSIDTFIWSGDAAWLNQHIFRVRENGAASRARIYIQLRALRPTFAEIARNKQTTGLGHVTISDLKRLKVCDPKQGIAERFDGITGPILEKIALNQHLCGVLAKLRDTLLPKLISGQTRVPEAEALVKASI